MLEPVVLSTPQSLGFRTWRRIARKARVCARFATERDAAHFDIAAIGDRVQIGLEDFILGVVAFQCDRDGDLFAVTLAGC